MKKFIILSLMVFVQSAFADGGDVDQGSVQHRCDGTIKKSIRAMQNKESMLEKVTRIDKKLAINMTKDAIDADEQEKAQVLKEIGRKNRIYYSYEWLAPSNSGTSVVVLDSQTCKIAVNILYYSEE